MSVLADHPNVGYCKINTETVYQPGIQYFEALPDGKKILKRRSVRLKANAVEVQPSSPVIALRAALESTNFMVFSKTDFSAFSACV